MIADHSTTADEQCKKTNDALVIRYNEMIKSGTITHASVLKETGLSNQAMVTFRNNSASSTARTTDKIAKCLDNNDKKRSLSNIQESGEAPLPIASKCKAPSLQQECKKICGQPGGITRRQKRRQKQLANVGDVYVFDCDGSIKVGFSKEKTKRRLDAAQTFLGNRAVCVYKTKASKWVERETHRLLSPYNLVVQGTNKGKEAFGNISASTAKTAVKLAVKLAAHLQDTVQAICSADSTTGDHGKSSSPEHVPKINGSEMDCAGLSSAQVQHGGGR